MIRATLDTNTLASAAVAESGPLAAIVRAWRRGVLEIAISEHILAELERTLRKPYFVSHLSGADREGFLSLLRDFATFVEIIEPAPSVLPDAADNLVLATALSANVPFVVTGDRKMRELRVYQGILILSAREFLNVLEMEQNGRRAIGP